MHDDDDGNDKRRQHGHRNQQGNGVLTGFTDRDVQAIQDKLAMLQAAKHKLDQQDRASGGSANALPLRTRSPVDPGHSDRQTTVNSVVPTRPSTRFRKPPPTGGSTGARHQTELQNSDGGMSSASVTNGFGHLRGGKRARRIQNKAQEELRSHQHRYVGVARGTRAGGGGPPRTEISNKSKVPKALSAGEGRGPAGGQQKSQGRDPHSPAKLPDPIATNPADQRELAEERVRGEDPVDDNHMWPEVKVKETNPEPPHRVVSSSSEVDGGALDTVPLASGPAPLATIGQIDLEQDTGTLGVAGCSADRESSDPVDADPQHPEAAVVVVKRKGAGRPPRGRKKKRRVGAGTNNNGATKSEVVVAETTAQKNKDGSDAVVGGCVSGSDPGPSCWTTHAGVELCSSSLSSAATDPRDEAVVVGDDVTALKAEAGGAGVSNWDAETVPSSKQSNEKTDEETAMNRVDNQDGATGMATDPVPAQDPDRVIINNEHRGSDSEDVSSERHYPDVPSADQQDCMIDEHVAAAYIRNPALAGCCVLRSGGSTVNQAKRKKSAASAGDGCGIVCCGVCKAVNQYRKYAENRAHESFLCSDCIRIVAEIFDTAVKGAPFSCISGPPVCEGRCPVGRRGSVSFEFCQACYAKTCLVNLRLTDDVLYFKVWRSIPPMSRGFLPTTCPPASSARNPNAGKLVYLRDPRDVNEIAAAFGEPSNPTVPVAGLTDPDPGGFKLSLLTNNEYREQAVEPPPVSTVLNCGSGAVSAEARPQRPSSTCDPMLLGRTEGSTIGPRNAAPSPGTTIENIDPVPKPDYDDIQQHGFPVVVFSPHAYAPKPMCFLCGSAGIEQLIFCSSCCEPYHPYCAGDDLLMDTCIAQLGKRTSGEAPADSNFSVRWTCRRCIQCASCSDIIGRHEMIRCCRCQGPFHLHTCVDKLVLGKIKDVERLRTIWTCDPCLACKSCSKPIVEANKKVKAMMKVRGGGPNTGCDDSDDEDRGVYHAIQDVGSGTRRPAEQPVQSNLMLCIECFKQRKKGSYCPVCDASYDDNDWESKMMECCRCTRWIHASCEGINDEEYHVLGTLPEYIEYVCRLCHEAEASVPGTTTLPVALWKDAVSSSIFNLCTSAIRLFEKKAMLDGGSSARKRWSSVDEPAPQSASNPVACVRKLFDPAEPSARTNDAPQVSGIDNAGLPAAPATWPGKQERVVDEETRISYKVLSTCTVVLRDFVKQPRTIEEQCHALKVLARDGGLSFQHPGSSTLSPPPPLIQQIRYPDTPVVGSTPISDTPRSTRTMVNSGSRVACRKRAVTKIRDAVRGVLQGRIGYGSSGIRSVSLLKAVMIEAVRLFAEGDKEVGELDKCVVAAIAETCPWVVEPDLVCEPGTGGLVCENEEAGNGVVKHASGGRNASDLVLMLEKLQNPVMVGGGNEDGNGCVWKGQDGCGDDGSACKHPFGEVFWEDDEFLDRRVCVLCGEVGDFPPDLCGRLLWCGGNEFIHVNCAVWSSEVYEKEDGALQQVAGALNRGRTLGCQVCGRRGATVSCCHSSCKNSYHFLCAIKAGCRLLLDKTMFCSKHALTSKQLAPVQEDMNVGRCVFVDLDWIQKRGITATYIKPDDVRVFVGSMRVTRLGTVVPISVRNNQPVITDKHPGSSPANTFVVPKNFRADRIFWSSPPRRHDKSPTSRRIMECFYFETRVSKPPAVFATGMTHDLGVNFVVKHCGGDRRNGRNTPSTSPQSGLLGEVERFHAWVTGAPTYIDEDLVEWMPRCGEAFGNLVAPADQGSGESDGVPLSSTSPTDITQVIAAAPGHDKDDSQAGSLAKLPYNLRRLPGRGVVPQPCKPNSRPETGNVSGHDRGSTVPSIGNRSHASGHRDVVGSPGSRSPSTPVPLPPGQYPETPKSSRRGLSRIETREIRSGRRRSRRTSGLPSADQSESDDDGHSKQRVTRSAGARARTHINESPRRRSLRNLMNSNQPVIVDPLGNTKTRSTAEECGNSGLATGITSGSTSSDDNDSGVVVVVNRCGDDRNDSSSVSLSSTLSTSSSSSSCPGSSTGRADESNEGWGSSCRVNLMSRFSSLGKIQSRVTSEQESGRNVETGGSVEANERKCENSGEAGVTGEGTKPQKVPNIAARPSTSGQVYRAHLTFRVTRGNKRAARENRSGATDGVCSGRDKDEDGSENEPGNRYFESSDPTAVWAHVLGSRVAVTDRFKEEEELMHPPQQVRSLGKLGITHRSVQFLVEQLPEASCVVGKHAFRFHCYGNNPQPEEPAAAAAAMCGFGTSTHNSGSSGGSARTTGLVGGRTKPFDMFGWLGSEHRVPVGHTTAIGAEDSAVLSRPNNQGLPSAMQFRELKEKANNKRFAVMRSEISGRGLFSTEMIEMGEMIIEYAGEVIRPSVGDPREKYYDSKGIGCYMFRVNKTQVIDATMKGNAARFINHSCEPNCEAKTIRVLGKDHIIIFALRRIFKGEELTYDYKFEREENKIPCSCGAPRCRTYMN